MLCKYLASLTAMSCLIACTTSAYALTEFDQDVTPDAIFGSGNDNGGFTRDRDNGVELGLRGKLRFNSSNLPENTFNSNGDGTYTFKAGLPPTGFSFDPNSPTTPVWNFEWSINTDYLSPDATSTSQLDDYTYELRLDGDPTAGTNFLTFDLINQPFFDHSIGNNTTGNGLGVEAVDAAGYATLIAGNNVAQNSWSYEFFNDVGTALENFDPTVNGVYTIELEAFSSGVSVASTSIDINVVPEPATIGLAAMCGLFGAAVYLRRRWG